MSAKQHYTLSRYYLLRAELIAYASFRLSLDQIIQRWLDICALVDKYLFHMARMFATYWID
jgi:hypothetical protein